MSTAAANSDPFRPNWWTRGAWLLLALYVVYAGAQMDASWERVSAGLDNTARFLGRMFPPNFTRWERALAEILALTVASIGFIGKLFAEAIEEISLKQVEAVRVTGAPFMSIIAFGVLPQVFTRFIGFCTYQLDSNLRNSTMVGIVGAGAIGGTLFAAFQRFDYDYVCAILISIITLIMIGEVLATYVRAIFIDGVSCADMFRRHAVGSGSRRDWPLEDD